LDEFVMAPQGLQDVIAVHIELTPGTRTGKPRVKGTRITVADIVLWTERGMSTDEIVTAFPQLGLADVYAALAYYHDNQQLIDQQIRASLQFVSQLKADVSQKASKHD
jgi:uncharacterized protein (DUF433 family)